MPKVDSTVFHSMSVVFSHCFYDDLSAPPFEIPSTTDERFNVIMDPHNKGGVKFLVNHWGIEDASPELIGTSVV